MAFHSNAQCLSNVKPTQDKDIAYKERGSRCEGLFSQQVSGSIKLQLIGYHSQLFKGAIPSDIISIRTERGDSTSHIFIQARSVRPRLNYLMDTKSVNQTGQFIWPTQIIKHPKISLKLNELAILATEEHKKDSSNLDLHLPVEIENMDTVLQKGLFIALIAETELKEVYITAKQGEHLIYEDLPFGLGYYPPLRAIKIPLINLPEGIVQFSVVGISHKGASSRVRFNLLIPQSPN